MAQRNIEIVQSKIDIPTILVEHDGRMLPIHSKYNPLAEAERIIDSYAEEINKSDHILFYGVGLGYHVKIAQERYPEKVFSVYEPIEQVSDQFVNLAKKTGVQLNNLAKNYVELSPDNIIPNIGDFSIYFAHRVLLLPLPIYEKLVPEELQLFSQNYKKILIEKLSEKQTNKKFNERWSINMMMNVKHTFTTPNILMQEKNPFEGKPVILVAAGPSLSDEIENLKLIKEKGLAYIFAVGSANKALLKHNLMPDAVLSYDPQGSNWQVFEELMECNITDIPLIFGTTVGHETVSYYPGPKAHVVISKDDLTPYLHDVEMVTVNDSATISNVTFQILQKLNVGKIVLVGQNFAYRDEQFYASGIKRLDKLTKEETDGKLQAVEIAKSFLVEDVGGGEVRTNETFDTMRKEMELYLKAYPNLVVVNTTQGGAKIEGAPFKTLAEIIDNEFKNSIVQRDWYEQLQLPATKLQQSKLKKIHQENQKFMAILEELLDELKQLKEQSQSKNIQKLERMLVKNYKLQNKMHGNLIYKLFIRPLANLYTEQIYAEVSLCNKMTDPNKKAETITNIYLGYTGNVLSVYQSIIPILNTNVLLPLQDSTELKYYEATCGVFHFEGNWEKYRLTRKEKKVDYSLEIYGLGVVSKKTNASISFKFKGKKIQLMGTNFGNGPLKLAIIIDGKIKNINIFERINDDEFRQFQPQILFDVDSVGDEIHEIEICVLDENISFNFLGVKVENEGQIYHIHEADSWGEMEEGDRIRCSYSASYNRIGEFMEPSNALSNWISIDSELQPNGDFYFIKVKENLFVADRVIQNYICHEAVSKRLGSFDLFPNADLVLLKGNGENNEWNDIFSKEKVKKCLNINYKDNYVSTWIKLDKENCQTTMRGDFYHFGLNEKVEKTLLANICTEWKGVSPGVGYRPVLRLKQSSM